MTRTMRFFVGSFIMRAIGERWAYFYYYLLTCIGLVL